MKTEPKKINIQDRMREKAIDAYDEVEFQIDSFVDDKKSSFSMYKYLKQLDYSSKVITFMKGKTLQAQLEVKNEEGCEQLEEAFSISLPRNKRKTTSNS